MSDWVAIFSSNKLFNAELVHGLLQENGIEAVVINKKDSNYLFGEVEVYVKPEDVIRAKLILEKHKEDE